MVSFIFVSHETDSPIIVNHSSHSLKHPMNCNFKERLDNRSFWIECKSTIPWRGFVFFLNFWTQSSLYTFALLLCFHFPCACNTCSICRSILFDRSHSIGWIVNPTIDCNKPISEARELNGNERFYHVHIVYTIYFMVHARNKHFVCDDSCLLKFQSKKRKAETIKTANILICWLIFSPLFWK